MGSFPGPFGNRGSGTEQASSDEVRVTGFEPAAAGRSAPPAAAARHIEMQEAAGVPTFPSDQEKQGASFDVPCFLGPSDWI